MSGDDHTCRKHRASCGETKSMRDYTELDNPLTQQVLIDYTHEYVGSFTKADRESPFKDPNGPIS